MASNPMGKCCIVGVKHQGTPKGNVKQIGNIRTYFAYPEDGSTQNAILLMTDALGMDFLNTQLIADQFAANGYLVVIPDVFNGNHIRFPFPPSFSLQDWVDNTMPRTPTVDPIYETVINHLRNKLGVKRLGGIGYCFGGKYVCRWLKPGSLDAGFIAHPSFVDADEVRGVQRPLSIAAAETDEIFPAEKRRQTEDILKETKVSYQVFLYSHVEHGFATKGNLEIDRERFAKEQAFFQAVFWMDEYVKRGRYP
ncbi:hypothetical protein COCCADRAFT_4891 [Bipolaris zeicola 26-R-13]|uniref:Dienelactone hydrolase domain-containing protein n=1 Tax=Cochliobolus carbonum (strain 26-R-13) TaxID=930089 RepID=W6YQ32_COCC2|nr:uncharacterized protein COCCADRAFT_4891 [Bipolaris zeicola 26-R-13]EUC33591.1 hypothetical protein COCCADRAFT_4891 [Bipolaris zeicola 26-R-13]